MTGTALNYFLGGNTSQGFFSHFSYIISQEEATRIISLKGGPGTGKSSLMKKVGKYYLDKGYEVEFHHCSSDDDSLDGVLIKELKIALLDGTAPHMIDPINPGAVDEIVNMAVCLNSCKLTLAKEDIIEVNKKIGKSFKRAYRFFAAAKCIYEDIINLNEEALNLYELNILKENLKNEILPPMLTSLGRKRHLFATAYTPNGIITYIENIIAPLEKVYVLKGEPGTGKTKVLSFIADEAVRRGIDVTVLHTPLIPEKIEHLIIAELNLAIVTSNKITNLEFKGEVYDMDSLLNKDILKNNIEKLQNSYDIFYKLLQNGLNCIKEAKELHDVLETYYVPNMNFKMADDIYEEIIEKINTYII